jgi:hypothetical protein
MGKVAYIARIGETIYAYYNFAGKSVGKRSFGDRH